MANSILGYNGSFYILAGITLISSFMSFFFFKEISGLQKKEIYNIFVLKIKQGKSKKNKIATS